MIKPYPHEPGRLYAIPERLVVELIEVLSTYQFSDGGCTNNEDIIDVLNKLRERTGVDL